MDIIEVSSKHLMSSQIYENIFIKYFVKKEYKYAYQYQFLSLKWYKWRWNMVATMPENV